jgi:DnaJ homolog subfamily C member 11
MPIHLSHELIPSAIFYGSLAPIVLFYITKKLLVEPYLREKEKEEAKKLQEKLKSEIKEKKRLALAAVRKSRRNWLLFFFPFL